MSYHCTADTPYGMSPSDPIPRVRSYSFQAARHRRRNANPSHCHRRNRGVALVCTGQHTYDNIAEDQYELQHADEPPLAERLFEIFRVLPLGIDEKALRRFYAKCADKRNDISHFGVNATI